MRTFSAGAHGLVVGLFLVLHFAFHPTFANWTWGPDLLVVGLALAALRIKPGRVAALGAALGLLEGALSLSPMGPLMVLFALAGYLAAQLRDMFYSDASRFLPTLVFAGVLLLQLAQYALAGVVLEPGAILTVPLSGVVSALVAWGAERLLASYA